MSQKAINSTIDTLFDEFIKAGGDIDKMSCYENENKVDNTDNTENTENVNTSDPQISEKTYFTDDSPVLDLTNSFSGDLLNNYVIYFKEKNKKPQNFTLLDGIDKDDPYSTNMALEELYFEMITFVENEKKNPELCKVIHYNDMDRSILNTDELHCVMINGKPELVSQSLFALLIELTNLKNLEKGKKTQNVYHVINLK